MQVAVLVCWHRYCGVAQKVPKTASESAAPTVAAAAAVAGRWTQTHVYFRLYVCTAKKEPGKSGQMQCRTVEQCCCHLHLLLLVPMCCCCCCCIYRSDLTCNVHVLQPGCVEDAEWYNAPFDCCCCGCPCQLPSVSILTAAVATPIPMICPYRSVPSATCPHPYKS